MRFFLSRLSISFGRIVVAALTGNYHDADPTFFSTLDDNEVTGTRLRAVIHGLNTSFASDMRTNGMLRKITPTAQLPDYPILDPEDCTPNWSTGAKKSGEAEGPLPMTQENMLNWVKQVGYPAIRRSPVG